MDSVPSLGFAFGIKIARQFDMLTMSVSSRQSYFFNAERRAADRKREMVKRGEGGVNVDVFN